MKQTLTAEAFAGLLRNLGEGDDAAGERYEELRHLLIKFFEWRSASYPEECADETLNRVARKIGEGVDIKNITAYCHEVARFVFLESTKDRSSKNTQLDDAHLATRTTTSSEDAEEDELRLACLDRCLKTLPDSNGNLIIAYYRNGERSQIDHRREIAERLGLRRDALANRVQRIRDKLEKCVKQCVQQ